MKYYVTIEDETIEVELTDAPGQSTATVQGHTYDINLSAITAESLFSLIVDHNSYEVLVEDDEPGLGVLIGGELFHIVVQDEWERRLATIQRKEATTTGEIVVRAPMPGAVIRVEVRVGDTIKRGQGLVVLSAMKMENEIRSPRIGRIIAVAVVEGDKVEQNSALVTIGPQEESSRPPGPSPIGR